MNYIFGSIFFIFIIFAVIVISLSYYYGLDIIALMSTIFTVIILFTFLSFLLSEKEINITSFNYPGNVGYSQYYPNYYHSNFMYNPHPHTIHNPHRYPIHHSNYHRRI